MKKIMFAAGLLPALLVAAVVQAGDIYKWVDEDGNVHYEDRPLGEETERLDIDSRPTDPARVQAVTQARAESRRKAEQAAAEAAAGQPTEADLQEEADERTKKCTDYRAKLESYRNNRRLYNETPDGERNYLSDEEITAARELMARRVAEVCE